MVGMSFERPRGGTRFRLFPQYDQGLEAEIVTVSSPAGSLRPGPSDHAMHVSDPVRKLTPYDPPQSEPPCRGPYLAPAMAGPGGHFDHIAPDTPQFLAAHLFGTVRRTLDVWEHYLGRRLRWWHAAEYPSLELIPLVDWQNAQSGAGFLETGRWPDAGGGWQPFCLNHDIVAHEVGHTILFSAIGVPGRAAPDAEFLGFHESFSDLIALIGALHFGSVCRRLLAQTRGNLYVLNLVSRLGETSQHEQIRIADNTVTMADVSMLSIDPDMVWHDPTGRGRNAHALAEPLTGAIFDVLVDLYQDELVRRRLIAPDNDPRGWTRVEVEASMASLRRASALALARFEPSFLAALDSARDAVGRAMAHVIETLAAEDVSYARVAARLLEGLALQGMGPMLGGLIANFTERGIDPAPSLRFRPVRGRPDRVRLLDTPPRACACHLSDRIARTRQAMTHPHRFG